ncbi:MAG: protein kinase family protein [Gammaproteobacteria bacterium]|jgi:serine/threonine protein kinase|nr:protein kinase family protein [Gammaproteobacteria bacterium]
MIGDPESQFQNSNQFNEFIERIEASKYRPIGEKLSEKISPTDLQKIYDYFLTNTEEWYTTHTPEQQREIQNHLTNIAALRPGQAYQIHKRDKSILPRTLTILHHRDGEFKLIVDTKRKLADDTKIPKGNEKRGAVKGSGKTAWRIDTGDVEYFSLIVKPKSKKELDVLIDEVNISQSLASDYVNENELGQLYVSGPDSKIAVYSLKANDSLADVLDGGSINFTPDDIDQMILDMLEGVKTLHDANLVHQDLKPANLLVYGDPVHGYRIKLTDFGKTQIQNANAWPAGTLGYHSPEMAVCYSDPGSGYYEYYQSEAGDFFATKCMDFVSGIPEDYAAPDKANDVWALGMIIYELKHGARIVPETIDDLAEIAKDPLTKGLLEPMREERITVDDAITLHKQQMALRNPERFFLSISDSKEEKPLRSRMNSLTRSFEMMQASQEVHPSSTATPSGEKEEHLCKPKGR